ncbi:transcriptional repressor [Arsenicitalea aurantiaca]|uniref:Ferric uptake regulation protein n=1 Tax=Arsenicitalea aurantiaca TaxID=1783274 RepID=A0A433X8B9_9HYPH|nr:Fur family transcriptional regulator [Arsenicitalea aurantiaca]RUT30288.1 transcriptional repressor [Arsenicitalea aurantiaca]
MTPNQALTRNQALVLQALTHAEAPVSAYGLLDLLRAEGLRAPLQVYRALEKLTELGLVHRLESLNAFVACAHGHSHDADAGPVAFAICEDCGRVDEFSDPVVEARLGDWAEKKGFVARRTTIELRGRCGACARA